MYGTFRWSWERTRVVLGCGSAIALVALSVSNGYDGIDTGRAAGGKFGLTAAPFFGHYSWPYEFWRWCVAVAVGVAVVAIVERVTRWQRWVAVIAASSLVGGAWAWVLQWVRNKDLALLLTNATDYRPFIPKVRSGYFADYIDLLPQAPTHVKGHPPLALGTVWVADPLVPGAFALAMVILGAMVLAMLLVLDTVRRTAGMAAARSAVMPVVLIPSAVWAFVSFDTVVMCEVALATWFATLALERSRRAIAFGALSGLVCGIVIFTTYGGVAMLVLPAVVLWRRWGALCAAAIGGGAVIAFFAGLGFWWIDGLTATKYYYVEGISSMRPYWYFTFLANPAIVAISIGPSAVIGWFRRRAPMVAWAALAGAVIADVSGMSKGEVERIWVPFMPWIAVGSVGSGMRARTVGALSIGVSLLVTLVLKSPW